MHIDDPADMTPDQRFREISSILARGVLRRRRTAELALDERAPRLATMTAKLTLPTNEELVRSPCSAVRA